MRLKLILSSALILTISTACTPHLYSGTSATSDTSNTWIAPTNSWSSNTPPTDLVGEGFNIGDIPADFRLTDQFGETASLWQFYGSTIVIDISTIWCAPCQEIAAGAEETYQHYKDDGLVYITVLPENLKGENPTVEDLNLWVDAFGLTSPVLADPDKGYTYDAVNDGSYPKILIVNTEMQIVDQIDPPSDAGIRTALDDLL